MENIAEVIKGVGFFSGLSREDLARVVGKFQEQRYSAGQAIVKQGTPADGMYVIQSGAVEVALEHDGLRVESVAILGPNEFFGEMSLFTGQQRSATVLALVDAVVLKLSNESWEELLSRYPSISFHVCKILSQRLAETDRQLSKGRGSFKVVMESFLSAQSAEIQQFLLHTSMLKSLDPS